jgi:acyl-CoA reductase-like NAD-dependent aldehyde dehydrogenase
VLLRVATLLRERAETFAVAEARNAGKPIGEARWEVEAEAGTFEYFAGAANKHFGEVVPVPDPGLDIVLREPVGVCALIVPWNFPLLITSWKTAPALACGNPVIIKPASLTPVTALMLGELLVDAGVPEGCVSVLPGPGGVVGDALVSDPRVNKISFTGETTTGASILRASSDNITRVSLELGGKSACVVFAEGDWERAVEDTAMAVFGNAGQDCCARSRIVVQQSIYDDFVNAFAKRTDRIKVGAPLDEATEMGPMISPAQRQVSLDYLAIGADEGAERITGGEIPSGATFGDGSYLAPAVLAQVNNDMRVAREEIFGPVQAIIPFRDEAEALAIANDSPYGLAGMLWTNDLDRAHRMAEEWRTGMLWVNCFFERDLRLPFGGERSSGIGREGGKYSREFFTDPRAVTIKRRALNAR